MRTSANEHYLTPMFRPRSVAVFGASDSANSVGTVLYRNVRKSGFSGGIYAINPKHKRVQGAKAHASLAEIDEAVDLAVIATPASTVPTIIEDCGRRGVPAAIVISAGFREIGDSGVDLERRMLTAAARHGVRILGPNCLGVLSPHLGLNATFSANDARPGKLALVSQSGALCTAILDWAESNNVGFSHVISTGIGADVGFGEILDFLVSDPLTEGILLYIEGIRDARRFMSALRAAARAKPIVAMKSGRHEQGLKAAVSHTAAMIGGDDIFDAALRRAGVVRVLHFSNFFAAATVLASGLRAKGDRAMIVTNGGGPGVMAADYLTDKRLQLAELSTQTRAALDEVLPDTWSHANPIDIIGDATPERYRRAVEICSRDEDSDGLVVILTPQAMTDPLAVAREITAAHDKKQKPLLTCWMGDEGVEPSRNWFHRHGIPTFRTPEAAVDAFSFLAAHHRNQQMLLQVPEPATHDDTPDVEGAGMIIKDVLKTSRHLLNAAESKAVLAAFRIVTTKSILARTPEEALTVAEGLGFPVVLKIDSADITHKSDVNGVRLNISGARHLRAAYQDLIESVQKQRPEARISGVLIESMIKSPHGRELMIGMVRDPVFGPTISFGMGGTLVEVLGQQALALPPLNRFLAKELMNSGRVARLLSDFRNLPAVDVESIVSMLLRVSEMICELPWLEELDINPLIADENGAIVVDARMVVEPRRPGESRYAHMAIHPYPTELRRCIQLSDGSEVLIRPIRPEDALIESEFVQQLSDKAKHFRFMYALKELTPAMLSRFTQIDYDREMALIAVVQRKGKEQEIGVTRYIINPDGSSCEFAIVVDDEWQGKGLATQLLGYLIEIARQKGLRSIEGKVLSDNKDMLQLSEAMGFRIERDTDDPQVMNVSKRI